MPKILIDGYKFEYTERGNGETILLVHGSSSDLRTWERQIEVFGGRYRTVAYSRRYHWPNEKIPEGADYSMMKHVDDLGAVINSLGVDSLHLTGHSYGAFVCLLYAMRNPGLIRSLILAEPPTVTLFVSNTPKAGEIIRLFLTRPRTALAIMRFGIKGFAPAVKAVKNDDIDRAIRAFGSVILGKETFRNLSEARMQQVRDNFIKEELHGTGFAPIDQSAVGSLNVPVLLIRGANSPALFHRLISRLEELLPNCKSTVIPDTSHIMHEDNSSAYNKAVLDFINKAEKRIPAG